MYHSHKFIQTPLFSFSSFGIDLSHDPLKILSDKIHWDDLIQSVQSTYSLKGRNSKSIRMMLGLEIAKTYFKGITDVQIVRKLGRDIGVMYLCGFECLVSTDELPDSSTMSVFRSHLTPDTLSQIEQFSIEDAIVHIPRKKRRQIAGDTTVLPVSVAYPTDVTLVGKAIQKLLLFTKKSKKIVTDGKRKVLSSIKTFSKVRSHTKDIVDKQIHYLVSFAKGIVTQIYKKKVSFSRKTRATIRTIEKVLAQQQDKLNGIKIKERIISIDEPHLRPIFRGKAGSIIEIGLKTGLVCIGEKILMTTHKGYNNFSDTKIQKKQVQTFKKRLKHNPSEYSFDRGGDSDENHHYLTNQAITDGIQCKGKDRRDNMKEYTKKRLYNKRTHIERNIGHFKGSYGNSTLNYKEENNPIRLTMGIMLHNLSTY